MKVSELIAELQKVKNPENTEVLVHSYACRADNYMCRNENVFSRIEHIRDYDNDSSTGNLDDIVIYLEDD